MTATVFRPSAQATRRPLPLLAPLAGVVAAGVPLLGAMAMAVVGWFVTDAGAHGAPRDALHTGASAWLLGHGSGLTVAGVRVTLVPLGITLLCAWMIWRTARRLGENVAGHGPDADALSDGERDLVVPSATGLFASAYLVVATVVGVLASTGDSEPNIAAVVGWAIVLTVGVGGAGIAVGSGRAAMWLTRIPAAARAVVSTAAHLLVSFLGLGAVVFTVSLVVDLDAAANVLSQMHTDAGDALLYTALMALIVPNAVLCAGSFLLGPGFAVGTGTLVSPTVVAVGPVPMLPMLAALPDNGPTPGWMPALIVLPPLLAALVVFLRQRRHPVLAWDKGALHGLVAGALAGVGFGLLTLVAGGAVGPGRMSEVGPLAGEVVFAGIVSLGLGGLAGGLLATALTRRAHPELLSAASNTDE